MRETIQIQYGDILRIYQVEEMADLGMRKVYSVYYANKWEITQKSLFICLAKDLNDVRTQFQAVVNERLKTKEQMDEYIKRCAQLQAQLDRKEAEFKEYFSFLLNVVENDWVKIDRIKLTKNEHLYRATRVNTGTTYYEITRKTGREQLKVLFKKVIEDDIKERKSHAKWKHVGEVETRKEGVKIVYEFFYLTLSNDRAVYKITEIKIENEHTKVDDFMVWEDELVKEDRRLRYMDNMKDNYLTLTKQMNNLREKMTTNDMINYELKKSLDDARELYMELYEKNKKILEENALLKASKHSINDFVSKNKALSEELKNAQKRLEEQKEQIEAIEDENDFLNEVTEAQIEEIKKLQEIIKRIKLKHSLEYEYVEKLERQKQHLKVVLRAEAYNRGMVQIKDFEEYVEKVLDDFL